MIIYGYLWMAAVLLLFVVSMYGVYSRDLFRAGPLLALVPASALGWWVRVEAYLLFLRIVSFSELYDRFVLLGTVSGQAMLIAFIFAFLLMINLVFPRTLRFVDMVCLACFSGFGISLMALLYGMVKVAVISVSIL